MRLNLQQPKEIHQIYDLNHYMDQYTAGKIYIPLVLEENIWKRLLTCPFSVRFWFYLFHPERAVTFMNMSQ